MANPELGSKQVCPNCQAKFYDLTKRPAHCPKCDTEFDPDEAVRNRRTRARAVVPEPEAEEERDDQVAADAEAEEEEEEEEEVVTPELDEVIDDPVLAADDDEDAEPAPAVSEDLGEFTDEEEVEDDADVPFLEDDDEDEFDETEIEGLPDEGDVDDR
ncbi:TIGR02300 family protein [Phenylobacterium sp.]|uniref:TIGR02300 family protein n=1 Tax=Phenylobacterium sp. TaxID=1871053 RepID=UPI00356670EE